MDKVDSNDQPRVKTSKQPVELTIDAFIWKKQLQKKAADAKDRKEFERRNRAGADSTGAGGRPGIRSHLNNDNSDDEMLLSSWSNAPRHEDSDPKMDNHASISHHGKGTKGTGEKG
ncbi:unnamed protein product, partial [Amoebophrya sp. A120]|eukprot:GSA120T00000233001.1